MFVCSVTLILFLKALLFILFSFSLCFILSLKVFPVRGSVSFIIFFGKLSFCLLCRLSFFHNVLEFDLNGWNVNIIFVFSFSFLLCEMNFVIRFKRKRNEFQKPFGNFFSRNGIRFRKVWNRFWNPFHKFPCFFDEMAFGIRFILFWNGSRIPFHKF